MCVHRAGSVRHAVLAFPSSFAIGVLVLASACHDSSSSSGASPNQVVDARFSVTTEQGQFAFTAQFQDESTGGVTSWSWDFGDGESSISQNPDHFFPLSGSYTVCLTVRGPAGVKTSCSTVTIGVAGGSGAPSDLFMTPTHHATGVGQLAALASADIDGDGRRDFALVLGPLFESSRKGILAILLGAPAGSPSPVVVVDSIRNPTDLAVADLNDDGLLDIVVADAEIGEALVYLQGINDTFAPAAPYALVDGPSTLFVRDFDGDDVLDIFTAGYGAAVAVLLGNGDGTFGPALFSAAGVVANLAAVGDVDGDGALDALVAGGFYGDYLLLGNGDGLFDPPVLCHQGGSYPTAAQIEDVTGDALPDIVLVDGNNRELLVLVGDGQGGLVPGFQYLTGSGEFPGDLAIADIDGDLAVDLLMVNGESLIPLMGTGGGDFVRSPSVFLGGSLYAMRLEDLDGDDDLDILASAYLYSPDPDISFSRLTSIAGAGDGTFAGPCSYPGAGSPIDVAIGDFVKDSVPDLAVLGYTSQVLSVLPGNGDGTFGDPLNTDLGMRGGVLAASDLDGNTLTDLVVGGWDFNGGLLAVLTSSGDGFFDPPQVFSSGGQRPSALEVGDMNGDQITDLVTLKGGSNKVAVHLGNLDGTFRDPLLLGVGLYPAGLVLADLDRDGVLDVAVGNQGDDDVSVLLGRGDGSLFADVTYPAGAGAGSLAAQDLDGDGDLDLAVTCPASYFDSMVPGPGIALLFGRGDGTFEDPKFYGSVERPTLVTLSDLDGDGKSDLLLLAQDGLAAALGRGDGSFGSPAFFATRAGYGRFMAVDDLNGDGRKDVALATGFNEGSVTVYLNQRGP